MRFDCFPENIYNLGFGFWGRGGAYKERKNFLSTNSKAHHKKSGLPAVHNFSMHKLAADIQL